MDFQVFVKLFVKLTQINKLWISISNPALKSPLCGKLILFKNVSCFNIARINVLQPWRTKLLTTWLQRYICIMRIDNITNIDIDFKETMVSQIYKIISKMH